MTVSFIRQYITVDIWSLIPLGHSERGCRTCTSELSQSRKRLLGWLFMTPESFCEDSTDFLLLLFSPYNGNFISNSSQSPFLPTPSCWPSFSFFIFLLITANNTFFFNCQSHPHRRKIQKTGDCPLVHHQWTAHFITNTQERMNLTSSSLDICMAASLHPQTSAEDHLENLHGERQIPPSRSSEFLETLYLCAWDGRG